MGKVIIHYLLVINRVRDVENNPTDNPCDLIEGAIVHGFEY